MQVSESTEFCRRYPRLIAFFTSRQAASSNSTWSMSFGQSMYNTMFPVSLFFFFSSRRRHTMSLRDWSSDVCSSDLRHDGDVGAALFRVAGGAGEARATGQIDEQHRGPRAHRLAQPLAERLRAAAFIRNGCQRALDAGDRGDRGDEGLRDRGVRHDDATELTHSLPPGTAEPRPSPACVGLAVR